MNDANDEDEFGDYSVEEQESWVCTRCDGKTVIVICIDDMCRNSGECTHGDGMAVCPECKGEF